LGWNEADLSLQGIPVTQYSPAVSQVDACVDQKKVSPTLSYHTLRIYVFLALADTLLWSRQSRSPGRMS
jgi:hypothetical protein